MIDRPVPTAEEVQQMQERLYKMYEMKNKADYEGSIAKYECTIKGERGLFKERMSLQSKDHVMEQFAYELACILKVPCCKASCRKANGIYGSFSKYEVPDLENVSTFSEIVNQEKMNVEDLFEKVITMTNGVNRFVIRLYQYIIFDFMTGQLDRHLENLSVYKKDNYYTWYPLYDNGLCCFSTYSNDNAIESLDKRFYSSRMGSDKEIIDALEKYRPQIFKDDIGKLVNYAPITKDLLSELLNKSDKYNQIGKERREATVNFVYSQITDIHKLNLGG